MTFELDGDSVTIHQHSIWVKGYLVQQLHIDTHSYKMLISKLSKCSVKNKNIRDKTMTIKSAMAMKFIAYITVWCACHPTQPTPISKLLILF